MAEGLAALGVPHAFGTRIGGVSPPPLDSLNVGYLEADTPERVRENWRRLLARAGLEAAHLARVRQVHGVKVVEAVREERPERPRVEADGIETADPGLAVAVTTADCVPVLAAWGGEGGRPGRVAALHAGWRGVVDGILARFLEARPEPPAALALGPHIRACCFEVGPEVAVRLEAAARAVGLDPARAVVPRPGSDRSLADLEYILLGQVGEERVRRLRLDRGAPCTFCDPRLFFSYRRDGPGRGLLGHVIGLPRETPR